MGANRVRHERLELDTRHRIQLVDLTPWVEAAVERSGILEGLVAVSALHTTAAVVVNENESRLLDDFREFLERLAPSGAAYRHDDLDLREEPPPPEEPRNGDSHLRALLLGASQALTVTGGRILLGRWQSVFLAELDGPRRRVVSVSVVGNGEAR